MSEAGRVPVTFEPSGARAWVAKGDSVLSAARAAGVHIFATCGGRGVCGACGVRVLSGVLAEPAPDEISALRNAPSGVRLACRAIVSGPVSVRPTVSSLSRADSEWLTTASELVAGVDLGTTTVSAVLLDRSTGRQAGASVVSNRQLSFGADVVSRVGAALDGHGSELRRLAEESVLDALEQAAPGATSKLTRIVIAGNPAMSSLLCGVDVASLGSHPFSPPKGSDVLPSDSRLRSALPSVEMAIVPPVAGFVGGDALAGMVILDFDSVSVSCLLVDIGTNAEVALVNKGRITVTSAAAGPAFDGVGIACAGPAVDGAVIGVGVDDDGRVSLTTMGEAEPTWFSGSGLISALASLKRMGHVTRDGRLHATGALSERFSVGGDGVVRVRFGDAPGALEVTQLDVRAIQLAKAAVRVAIGALLRDSRVRSARLGSVYVSGAFGGALDPADLAELGIVPADAANRVESVGNSSLMGAAAMALDPSMMERAQGLANSARHLDLAVQNDFAERLIEAVELDPFRV